MEQYHQISIHVTDERLKEILVAELSETGYSGFEETDSGLNAFIEAAQFDETIVNFILNKHSLNYLKSVINKQNWNQLWESNFAPVQVGNFVGVRAHFHPVFENVKHEIVITPKMSFGTGHHATTYTVLQLMESIDFQGKSVYDFGTGTGILAIMAEKLGAKQVWATDNDPWCVENASENSLINECKNIDIQLVESGKTNHVFDVVIANINKNIILDNLDYLVAAAGNNGNILLSGLLEEDEPDIIMACESRGWKHRSTLKRAGWIALHLSS